MSIAVALVATLAEPALACPCQGSSGSGAAVTTAAQRYGVSATTSGRVVHGAFTPDGDYAALGPGSSQWMLDLALSLGVRPIEPVELGIESAVGYQSIEASGFDSKRAALGDTSVRASWEAVDEPMPWEDRALPPSVTLAAGLRMPTGFVGRQSAGAASGTTGSIGSSAASQGLGAWEPRASVEIGRSFTRRFRIGALGEVGYRFPDTALGIDRQLGPRALGQLNVRGKPTVALGIGWIIDLGWEGPVAYDGRTRVGTAQRALGTALYAYYVLADAGIRLGAMLRTVPPIEGVNVNNVSSTSLALSVGYAR